MSAQLGVSDENGTREPPEPILISALQHWSYCPRQCRLIHLEQTYDENLHTLRGKHAHARVDRPGNEARRGARVERGLPLWSRRLGLTGKADTVEFVDGVPDPVEYKVGARKAGGHAELQLCAQALCLEGMLGVAVPRGALYYHASRRRHEVEGETWPGSRGAFVSLQRGKRAATVRSRGPDRACIGRFAQQRPQTRAPP